MTNKEYAAGLLIEAADLLNNESAGANGASRRYYEERSKARDNDAKYCDKQANKFKNDNDEFGKNAYKYWKRSRDEAKTDSGYEKDMAKFYDTRTKRGSNKNDRIKREFMASFSRDTIRDNSPKMNTKSKAIHDKINKRAGMHESVSFEMLEN